MALGSERGLLIDNPAKRAVVRLVGDTHFGRVLRFLYFRQALDHLALRPRAILDAGCGKGYLSLYLARRFPGARVLATDIGAADLDEAERARHAARAENLAFVRADLQQPIGVGAFDLIISSEVLEYVSDEQRALANFHAALRPGGVLLLHLMHAEQGYRNVGARRIFKLPAAGWRDDGMVRAGYTEDGLLTLLQSAGFADIQITATFGRLGMLAHSWFEVGRTWPAPLYLALFPFLVILAHLDTGQAKSHGGGLLTIARKSERL